MIKRLDHRSESTAQEIRALFQSSYRVEAEILQIEATKFPPLNRTLVEFQNSASEFYGEVRDQKMVALIQVSLDENATDIDSLVVHPDYFRQGLGIRLMKFVLNNIDSKRFTVETGLKNIPAIALYKQLGFREIAQWDTDFGVKKVQLELERSKL